MADMARRIKLMADYECWPLWGMHSDEIGNIDPATLPLPARTVARLNAWAEAFDARLDPDDPARSTPVPSDEAERFEREGLALWSLLGEQLGPAFTIHYFSEAEGRVVSPEGR